MKKELNRRQALRIVGASAGAFFAGGVAQSGAAEAVPASGAVVGPDCPAWKYVAIDPDRVAEIAYENYEVGRCMFATFLSVVSTVAETLAKTDPVASAAISAFPFHMMKYGDSGANGWGTLCGTVNGAMAAISLFTNESKTRAALCDEVAHYYERELLPVYAPKDDDFGPMPQTISGSLLCHVSSGKWSHLAQVRTDSPERTERCKRLAADVARKTAEVLNLNVAALHTKDVAPVAAAVRPEPVKTCVECHDKKGTNSNIIGKFDCTVCHPDHTVDHHQTK
ncbi:MAG: C_GCAxxG_C_C family protein [Thermoguttaceae bacterium]|nr:C_GCAxxG_C_C family protein [Thermoguttaceae bacterium]